MKNLTYNGTKYNSAKLMDVGHEIASMWGGSCLGYEVLDDRILFDCVEHGERFASELTFDELEKEYK